MASVAIVAFSRRGVEQSLCGLSVLEPRKAWGADEALHFCGICVGWSGVVFALEKKHAPETAPAAQTERCRNGDIGVARWRRQGPRPREEADFAALRG